MPRPSKRDQLVDAALELFYRDGIHATGIDAVIAHANVARMTLYKHFRSKEDLVVASLRRRDERFRADFLGSIDKRARTPREKLLAMFDALEEWFSEQAASRGWFGGCPFINACAEYSDPDHPVHRAAVEHKRLLQEFVQGLAEEAGARDPEALARALLLLQDGAIVTAQLGGGGKAAREAKEIASGLIHAALEPAGSA